MAVTSTSSGSGRSTGAFRPWAAVASLAWAVCGAVALVVPFVETGSGWQWRPRSEADLVGATVNAEALSVDDRGVMLSPQGERAISIITTPLTLAAGTSRVVVVELATVSGAAQSDAPARDAAASERCVVRLLWQTEPVEGFKFLETEVVLASGPVRAMFSLTEAPERIHRLGVQVLGRRPIFFRGIELTNLSTTARVKAFAGQAIEREPLRNHSINFIRGPVLLGHGLNYYLCALIAVAVGGYLLRCVAARRRIDWRVPIGVTLAAWLLGDIQATANLIRNVRDEVRDFGDLPRDEQIALSEGPDIAWACEQLVEHCPEGETYAVVSDDPFTPAHRLDYLLAPQRTRVELTFDEPEFIVVIGSSELRYDDVHGIFQFKSGPPTPATLVAKKSDTVYLLRRGDGR